MKSVSMVFLSLVLFCLKWAPLRSPVAKVRTNTAARIPAAESQTDGSDDDVDGDGDVVDEGVGQTLRE